MSPRKRPDLPEEPGFTGANCGLRTDREQTTAADRCGCFRSGKFTRNMGKASRLC